MAHLQLKYLFLSVIKRLGVHVDLPHVVRVGVADVGLCGEEHRARGYVGAERRIVGLTRGRAKLRKIALRNGIEATNGIYECAADTRCGVRILVLGLSGQAAQCCRRVIHTRLLLRSNAVVVLFKQAVHEVDFGLFADIPGQ